MRFHVANKTNCYICKEYPISQQLKIMRRILRKIAANESDQLGDISTLADPSVVKQLIEERARR
jgi:acetyl-CoA synthetase